MNIDQNPSDSIAPISRIHRARLSRLDNGLSLIDLSDGNPTTHGLSLDWRDLNNNFESYLTTRDYQPDAHGLLAARQAIADYYAQRTPALTLSPDSIFIVSSTSEGYGLMLSLLCKPGDVVLNPQICYPIFELIADRQHVHRISYPHFPIREIGAPLLKGARATFIVSPHNPTGEVWSNVDASLVQAGIPIISDEVFADFTADGKGAPALGALYHDNPVFHLNGISKMCGLPDFKLAWIALNNCAAERYGTSLEFLNDIYLNASYPMQSLLPAILRRRDNYQRLLRERVSENLASAERCFQDNSRIQWEKPAGGYMLFPRISLNEDHETFILSLLDRGVYVHPGYFYNWENDFRLVISLLLQPDRFEEAVSILSDAVRQGL